MTSLSFFKCLRIFCLEFLIVLFISNPFHTINQAMVIFSCNSETFSSLYVKNADLWLPFVLSFLLLVNLFFFYSSHSISLLILIRNIQGQSSLSCCCSHGDEMAVYIFTFSSSTVIIRIPDLHH